MGSPKDLHRKIAESYHRDNMDKSAILAELRRVADLVQSEYLSRSMYQKHATVSSGAAERVFSSWNEAIVAAGLRPLPSGGIPKAEQRRLERLANTPTGNPR
jgi:hypothetical protein